MKREKHRELMDNQLSITNYQLICFSFLAFCFLASLSRAETEAGCEGSRRRFENRDVFNSEISSEQLDPTNFLVAHLAKLSQDMNTPNVTAKTSQDVNMPVVTAKTSQNVNSLNVPGTPNALLHVLEPPMQADKLPSAPQKQSQTSPDSIRIAPVSSDVQATRRSERKKPLALSNVKGEVEGEESLLIKWPDPSALPQSLPRTRRGDDSKKRRQSPQASPTIIENPNNQVLRQLWQAGISIPKRENDKRSKNELQQIIEQIRTAKFEPQNRAPEPVIVLEPVPTVEPNETLSDTGAPEEPEGEEIESKLQTPPPYEPVTNQTLQMLENLSQHPDQLDNPFELAEVLFLSGYLKEASVFYQEALNRSSPDKADSAQDRAWILFQIGNCLRNDDPLMAMKMYRQLITKYPDSPWMDLAKTRHKLIDWYQKDKPQTLIVESQL